MRGWEPGAGKASNKGRVAEQRELPDPRTLLGHTRSARLWLSVAWPLRARTWITSLGGSISAPSPLLPLLSLPRPPLGRGTGASRVAAPEKAPKKPSSPSTSAPAPAPRPTDPPALPPLARFLLTLVLPVPSSGSPPNPLAATPHRSRPAPEPVLLTTPQAPRPDLLKGRHAAMHSAAENTHGSSSGLTFRVGSQPSRVRRATLPRVHCSLKLRL